MKAIGIFSSFVRENQLFLWTASYSSDYNYCNALIVFVFVFVSVFVFLIVFVFVSIFLMSIEPSALSLQSELISKERGNFKLGISQS